MKIVVPKVLCKYRNEPTAACFSLRRCQNCGRVLRRQVASSGAICDSCRVIPKGGVK